MDKIPKYAKGTALPTSVYMREMDEAKTRAEQKERYHHDWAIAIFSFLGGALSGLITTLITLKVQGLL